MRRIRDDAPRIWHVFARGARRLALFYEDKDFRMFLLFVQEALLLSGCSLYGYVLMGNHYHLILQGSQAQLTRCMQRLNYRYALFHNEEHRLGGHVFDGPYQAYPQRSLKWLLWRLAYVFLNPVMAGGPVEAGDYPWSGIRSFLGQEGSPLEVAPLPDLAVEGYSIEQIRTHVLLLMDEQQRYGKARGTSTPTAGDIQSDQFDWIRRQAEDRVRRVQGVDAVELALWWGREAGVPPRVMAGALGLASSEAARQKVRRFKDGLDRDDGLARQLVL